MFDAVFNANSNLKQQTKKLLQGISNVSRNCSNKILLMESRVKALENARLCIDTSLSPPAAGHRMEPSNEDMFDAMLNGSDLRDTQASP